MYMYINLCIFLCTFSSDALLQIRIRELEDALEQERAARLRVSHTTREVSGLWAAGGKINRTSNKLHRPKFLCLCVYLSAYFSVSCLERNSDREPERQRDRQRQRQIGRLYVYIIYI